MLIGISGTTSSGKTEVARYLTFQGFTLIGIKGESNGVTTKSSDIETDGNIYTSSMEYQQFESLNELVDYVTLNWRSNFVFNNLDQIETLNIFQKRPFFLHISVDAPMNLRYQRYKAKNQIDITLEQFLQENDKKLFCNENPLIEINNQANIKIINTSNSIKNLFIKLSELNLIDLSRLRPSWDSYFMRLADLAALRSNCMKRRVGCVIVRGNTVVATGYNGTPRHLTNCNEGGCDRCNKGQGSGAALSTCLCLHAEENALLESGRDRINGHKDGSTLYCNTCPCLTCSIKIVQSGITEVVYAQSYSMDEATHRVMSEAGIVLRQFSPAKDGIFI
ncbi:deoxycytidylate deaminase [[Candida] jaroonii]|uniref:Deoxycytidylate deaminase n=1 Tax=[Candida] jaroonii TaxID=467808 RepID=A0ACA9Y636_9ASCO|nr:deoxycytidylate deaminase [[Candida] jaroonii]